MSSGKKYGLLLPEKMKSQKKPVFQATRNVFGNDSESEEESNPKPVLLKPSGIINRQAKVTQEKAVKEDPTVYQYDEIYDSMVTKKEEAKSKTKVEKKPKYIENLIKSATKRKMENERRLERQIQKEREDEGDEFADKEVFVTSAYKKKLEEMRQQEEEEKREEYLENIGDVTKQKDLGGFYRHLYEQKLGSDKKIQPKEPKEENESKDSKPVEGVKHKKEECSKSENIDIKQEKDKSKSRNYRKRKPSNDRPDLSDGEIEDSDEEINHLKLVDIRNAKKAKQNEDNIDADSDFSIDDSSDEDSDSKQKNSEDNSKAKPDSSALENSILDEKIAEKSINIPEPSIPEIKEPPKPKIDIWKKRTVGEAFDQALKRYYERKSARSL